jgi:hypothetical protein
MDRRYDEVSISCSDDECLERLANLVERRSKGDLEETARLIARLAIPVE